MFNFTIFNASKHVNIEMTRHINKGEGGGEMTTHPALFGAVSPQSALVVVLET